MAKEQAIPAIQEQLADCILRMQQELHKYIDEKSTIIIKNSEYAYDNWYMRIITTHIH